MVRIALGSTILVSSGVSKRFLGACMYTTAVRAKIVEVHGHDHGCNAAPEVVISGYLGLVALFTCSCFS